MPVIAPGRRGRDRGHDDAAVRGPHRRRGRALALARAAIRALARYAARDGVAVMPCARVAARHSAITVAAIRPRSATLTLGRVAAHSRSCARSAGVSGWSPLTFGGWNAAAGTPRAIVPALPPRGRLPRRVGCPFAALRPASIYRASEPRSASAFGSDRSISYGWPFERESDRAARLAAVEIIDQDHVSNRGHDVWSLHFGSGD